MLKSWSKIFREDCWRLSKEAILLQPLTLQYLGVLFPGLIISQGFSPIVKTGSVIGFYTHPVQLEYFASFHPTDTTRSWIKTSSRRPGDLSTIPSLVFIHKEPSSFPGVSGELSHTPIRIIQLQLVEASRLCIEYLEGRKVGGWQESGCLLEGQGFSSFNGIILVGLRILCLNNSSKLHLIEQSPIWYASWC